METRASYLLVGTFTLLGMAGIVIAVVWMAGLSLDRQYDYYDIYFTGTVTGLQVGGPVRYRGIPVGTVRSVDIDPENIERVRVAIEVGPDTPIKTDTVASLQPQGLTGLSFVQLTGGTQAAPMLEAKEGQRYPVIESEPSGFERLVHAAPELLANANTLIERVGDLVSEQNREKFDKTLDNIGVLTGTLAERKDDLASALADAAGAMKELRAAAGHADGLLQTLGSDIGGVSDEANAILREIRQTAVEFRRASTTLAQLIERSEDPVEIFTSSGLYELTQLLAEMRVLVNGLTRISSQFEQDPARFLLGRGQPGLEVQ